MDLLKDRNLGVIYIESEYEYNRLHLNSLTTLFIYTYAFCTMKNVKNSH
jgi:hypothetical protein